MRLEGEDIRRMPLSLQEQVAMAMIPQSGAAVPVAGRGGQRVEVWCTCFVTAAALRRYRKLRQYQNQGRISDLCAHLNEDHKVYRFTYTGEEIFK